MTGPVVFTADPDNTAEIEALGLYVTRHPTSPALVVWESEEAFDPIGTLPNGWQIAKVNDQWLIGQPPPTFELPEPAPTLAPGSQPFLKPTDDGDTEPPADQPPSTTSK